MDTRGRAGPQYLPAFLIGKTSRQINATNAIWSFFEAHPKRIKISAGQSFFFAGVVDQDEKEDWRN